MLNRIISAIMSLVISITGIAYSSFNGMIDSLTEMIFGIPYSAEAIKADFFSDITMGDIETEDGKNGYINNKIVVFINQETSFADKLGFFNSCGGKLVGWSTPADLYVIEYGEMKYDAITAKCDRLSLDDAVELAVPVTVSRYSPNATPSDDFGYLNITEEWDEIDPDGRNWWLEAIDARQAWDYSEYLGEIDIGVIDAGFDTNHPDLSEKIFFPSERLANRNYQDSHGCHVAGIIGASHNGVGIAGICDNSDLICVDWLPDLLQFWISDLAIYFGFSSVVKAGAKVVNFSVGSASSKVDNDSPFSEREITPRVYSYLMSSLLAKGYDFVAVQSAGNGNESGLPINAENNGLFTPINENNVFTGAYGYSADEILGRIIIVSAAENRGNGQYVQSFYSNVGSTVSIAAPGDDIYSCSTDGEYEYMSGTSMSAPVVTGVASLVWSVNPDFTGPEVKEIVCSSTDSIAKINNRAPYVFEDLEIMEYPLVNAKLAVEEAIRRTDGSTGTVVGAVDGEAAEIVFDGVSHTIYSDGTYSFVTAEHSGNAVFFDKNGERLGSIYLTVEAGETTDAGVFVAGNDDVATPSDII